MLASGVGNYFSFEFGWDQAMMEAVASGLVPVAPAHSAYLAYLDATIAHLIPSRDSDPEERARRHGATDVFSRVVTFDNLLMSTDFVPRMRALIDAGVAGLCSNDPRLFTQL